MDQNMILNTLYAIILKSVEIFIYNSYYLKGIKLAVYLT